MKKGRKSKRLVPATKGTNKGKRSTPKKPSEDILSDLKFSKAVINNSPIIITILEKDGSVSYTNPSISKVHGAKKKEVEHRSIVKFIHPIDAPSVRKMFNVAMKSNGTVDFGILRMRLKDGSYHSMKCFSKLITDSSGVKHIVVYSSDITAQMDYERELAESEERFHSLADTALDMIFIVNKEGIVEYVNKASAEQLRKKTRKIIGSPLGDFFPPYILRRMSKSLDNVFRSGKPVCIANDTPFPTGQKLLDTWLVPLKDEKGKVRSVFGISRDVTKFKNLSEELRQKTAEAEEAKVKAQVFFDFLAHDVANLISPALTYSGELSKKEMPDPNASIQLKKIYEQMQRTAKLITNLRMLIEAEKCSPSTTERFNLGDFFLALQQMVSREYPGRCTLSLELPKSGSAEVIGGIHIRNAFMQGFSDAMGSHSDTCMSINVKIHQIKKGGRQFWQVRMEMPERPLSADWKERVVAPFDPSRREKGRTLDSIAFAAAIIGHFGGDILDDYLVRGDPSKGHVVTIELPKAGTWHDTKNT